MKNKKVPHKLKLNESYEPFSDGTKDHYGASLKIQQVVSYEDLSDEWKGKYEYVREQKSEMFAENPIFLVGYFYIVLNPFDSGRDIYCIYRTLQGWPKYPCVLVSANNNKWVRLNPPRVLDIFTDKLGEVVIDIDDMDYYKKQYQLYCESKVEKEPQIVFITKEVPKKEVCKKNKVTAKKTLITMKQIMNAVKFIITGNK